MVRVTLYSFSYRSNTSYASFYIIELIFSKSQAGSCIDKYFCMIVINLLVKQMKFLLTDLGNVKSN